RPDEIMPINMWHLHVREQEVHSAVKFRSNGDSLARARGGVDLIPRRLQHPLDESSQGRFIIDDQNRWCGCIRASVQNGHGVSSRLGFQFAQSGTSHTSWATDLP